MGAVDLSPDEGPPSAKGELLLDSVTTLLFVGFVVFLFIGYLGWWPVVPSTVLSSLFLLGSLAVLFWSNVSADHAARRASAS